MMTSPHPPCPRCGAPRVDGDGWTDLCPACLLATALAVEDEPCPYQVLAPIAETPRAITYLAERSSGERQYVALTIHHAHEDHEAVLSRYRRWKPVLNDFRHPNVAALLDVGVTGRGHLYVASSYAPGWPLTTLDTRPSLGAEARIALAGQLVAAVESAHGAGLAHLKLKPSVVKFSITTGVQATILGLGIRIIVDGQRPEREPDLSALTLMIRELGIPLSDRPYESASAIAEALRLARLPEAEH